MGDDLRQIRIVDEDFGVGLGIPGPVEQFMIEGAIAKSHYLNKYPDPRCMSFAYSVYLRGEWVGCLVFGRPQAGKLYRGPLTYGSNDDVSSGKTRYCRWELLNLSRVWFSPDVQAGGRLCQPDAIPGFHDRKGQWRPAFASRVIRAAIDTIRLDYLMMYPPVFFQRWHILAIISYCDTRLHKGTIYRASGFYLASTNRQGIETYALEGLSRLDAEAEAMVRRAGKHHPRSIKKRNAQGFRLPANFFGV